jgi:hypothetical protein
MAKATYLLVLQFTGDSSEDLDAIIEIEDQLTSLLGESAGIDGHDVGSNQTNIFINSAEPLATFQKCRSLLQTHGAKFDTLKAAFRSTNGSKYTVLYPEGTTEFAVA